MALTSIQNRSLVVAPKAKPAAAAKPAVEPAKSTNPALKAVKTIHQVAPSAAMATLAAPALATAAFTPPLIFDIIKASIRQGVGLMNLAWFVVPSAINNIRDITNDKISVGRGAANVVSDTGVAVVKGIAASVAVQSLSVIAGPLLSFLPMAVLPFAGIAIGIGGLVGTYWLLGKVVNKTGVDKKISDGLTKLFGGDKPAPTPAPAKS